LLCDSVSMFQRITPVSSVAARIFPLGLNARGEEARSRRYIKVWESNCQIRTQCLPSAVARRLPSALSAKVSIPTGPGKLVWTMSREFCERAKVAKAKSREPVFNKAGSYAPEAMECNRMIGQCWS